MKKRERPSGAEELRRAFPLGGLVEGWVFRVGEQSPGQYVAEGRDLLGRMVAREGADPDAALNSCVAWARAIVEQVEPRG